MMKIRSIIFKIIFVIITFLWSSFIILLIVLPFGQRYKIATRWGDTIVWLARLIVGIKWEVKGQENIPSSPCVVLANHQSTWETAFMPMLKRKQIWVLKKELMRIPFFGWALWVMKPVAIDRKQKKQAMQMVIRQGKERIKEGFSVTIFPEGTRSSVDSPQAFRLGAARLAAELGVPVVPIAHNAGQFWPKKGWLHSGTVQVEIGKPIDTTGKTAAEINNMAEQWVSETRTRLIANEKARRGEILHD